MRCERKKGALKSSTGVIWPATWALAFLATVPASVVAAPIPGIGGILDRSENSSVLVSFSGGPDQGAPSFSERLVNKDYAAAMRGNYESAVREQEILERHSLIDRHERKAYYDRMSGMAHVILEHIRHEQSVGLGEKAKNVLRSQPGLRRPMEIVAGAYALYSGRTLKFRAHPEVLISFSIRIPERSGSFQVNSPLGETGLEVKNDPRERTRFSYSRDIPDWRMRTSVSVGPSSNSVIASVSKQLTDQIAAVYESRLRIEDKVQLVYALAL